MKRYCLKAAIIVFVVIAMFVSCSLTVFADAGPKPYIYLTVENAPDEPYYVDMLIYCGYESGELDEYYSAREETLPDKIGTITPVTIIYDEAEYRTAAENMYFYSEGDWYARLNHDYHNGQTALTASVSNGQYKFFNSYEKRVKFIITTESGKIIVSDEINRKAYLSDIIWDAESGRCDEDIGRNLSHTVFEALLNLMNTLLLTLLIEGFIFLLFIPAGFGKKSALVFLVSNFSTQLFLYICLILIGFDAYFFAEIILTLAEAAAYYFLFDPPRKIRNIVYAIIANAASFIISTPLFIGGVFMYVSPLRL